MNEPQPELDGESLITPTAVAADIAARYPTAAAENLATATAELGLVLNTAQQWFVAARDPAQIMRWTVEALHNLRHKVDPVTWRLLIPIAQHHPVAAYFHQDPFTRWSFEKPRGYSGDANLLDFIYRHQSVMDGMEDVSPIGRELYSYSKFYPSCVAVRERRDLLTRYVDDIAERKGPATEVLTIAAGHLREAENSAALRQGRLARWVALDQDPMSLGTVARDFAGTSVTAIDGSVRGLLRGIYKLGSFDFAYSAGLYDYLTDAVAIALTKRCIRLLKPKGVMLFANFSPDLTDDGYMETFMNWTLLLRSEADMWKIVNGSVDRNEAEAEVFPGENRNILYAAITKRS
jgi:SAM-dependent methyltransferase